MTGAAPLADGRGLLAVWGVQRDGRGVGGSDGMGVDVTLGLTEVQQLAECEAVIERGMYAFVEVGNALLAIREGKLYRQYRQGITFAEYCKERWKFEHDFARKQIRSAQVIENLKSDTTVLLLPAVETQSRPLTTLPPSQQATVWQMAVDSAPNGVVTAKHVEATVRQHKREEKRLSPIETLPPTLTLRCGDMAQLCRDLPAGSVDFILTDPPYPREFLHVWDDLAREARRLLKPGGYREQL